METGKKTGLYSPELLDCSPVQSEKKLDWTVVMCICIFLTSQTVERDLIMILLGALLWGKWGLFEPQGIQALKSSAVWCNGIARGVS